MKVYLTFYYGIESIDKKEFNYFIGAYDSMALAVGRLEEAIEIVTKAGAYEPCTYEELEKDIFKGKKDIFNLTVVCPDDNCHIYDVRRARIFKHVSGRIFYILEQEVKTKPKQNEENKNNQRAWSENKS